MSHGSSESRLKALESAKGDPDNLLKQAISIAGLDSDEVVVSNKVRSASKVSQTFKEQWLLRWTVKRLSGAIQESSDSKISAGPQSFATSNRTWAFLSYLLNVIPFQKSSEILLERNFTKLLLKSSRVLIEQHQVGYSHISLAADISKDSKRPQKRRRLSPLNEIATTKIDTFPKSLDETALLGFLRVVELWGDVLRSGQETQRGPSRTAIPAWANSLNEAAEFIGCVLATTEQLLYTAIDQKTVLPQAETIVPWLQLWHTFAASSDGTDKTGARKSFNEACLHSCLSLRDLLVIRNESSCRNALKELEKQIALYTIAPLRSAILSKPTAVWRAEEGVISWEDVEPVYNLVEEQLGTALRSQIAHDRQPKLSPKDSWACCLISIASRLVPKADIRNRLSELSWIQAFIVSVAHLTFPREMPRLFKNPDGLLQPIPDPLPPDANAIPRWPEDLLTTLLEEEIALSMSAKEYLFASVCLWKNRPLPLAVTSALIKMDPRVFLPDQGRPNSGPRLNNLLLIISEKETFTEIEYDCVIKGNIQSLMSSAIKARDFDGWLGIWVPALTEALRVRATVEVSTENIPVALIWDDADLFIHFTNLCHQHQLAAFDRTFAKDTLEELKTIHERIGPTSDIFAKLAIFDSLLQARGSSLLQHSEMAECLDSLADSVAKALQDHNDYQGQRWRLWALMTTLCRLDTRFDRHKMIVQVLEITSDHFCKMSNEIVHKLQQSRRCVLLMEQHAIFGLLLECLSRMLETKESEKHPINRLVTDQVQNLVKLLNELRHPSNDNSDPNTGSENSSLWDGKINNLRGIKQFVEGHIAILLSCHHHLERDDPEMSALLVSISLALDNDRSSSGNTPAASTFVKHATSFLASSKLRNDDPTSNGNMLDEPRGSEVVAAGLSPLEHGRFTKPFVDSMARSALKIIRTEQATAPKLLYDLSKQEKQGLDLKIIIETAARISDADESKLQKNVAFAKSVASSVLLDVSDIVLRPSQLVLLLEYTAFVLKSQTKVINQASIDTLLKNMVIVTSAALKVDLSNSAMVASANTGTADVETAIFDRVIALVGILLTRYRRRLTGRTHLLLPVLQNLLRIFFYTPNRSYLYQNAATARQKAVFRTSLPTWLTTVALPPSSATKFTKIVTSICNPSTASARSAHHARGKKGSASLELNDETQRARKIAARYMQHLIMEFARCSLDGVIVPAVRESLMPGMYTILDAMDRDLMKAMSAAMDPSSRAIFKGMYDDWAKHWKWNQS